MNIWDALRLSLLVTATATVGIVIIGLPLALLLARGVFRGKLILQTLINLPLVLPPSVVGYYLLFVFGRGSFLREQLGLDVLFTWPAAAAASLVVGLPLIVQAARAAFEDVETETEDAARVDGAAEWQVWWYVTLPLARRGIVAGLILASARAMGEFGATLMVAGNIPGRTQTLPLAIYDLVQSRRYHEANLVVLMMTALAFAGVWFAYQIGASSQRRGQARSARQRSRSA